MGLLFLRKCFRDGSPRTSSRSATGDRGGFFRLRAAAAGTARRPNPPQDAVIFDENARLFRSVDPTEFGYEDLPSQEAPSGLLARHPEHVDPSLVALRPVDQANVTIFP